MLDRYVYGSVRRQSPEAPIPILSYENENFQLGGVGNVVKNLSDIGSKSTLISLTGKDKASKIVKELLKKESKIKSEIVSIQDFKTPVKTRYINNSLHLLRVDEEDISFHLKKEIVKKIKSIILKNIKECDLIILSDYDKGLLSRLLIKEITKIAENYNKTIIADPKKLDFSFYQGIDILTPNLKEISDSAGKKLLKEKEITNYARKIIKKHNINEILVTRSSEGMLLIGEGYIKKIKANAKKVRDVTGAGDTVISVLSLMKAIGMSTVDASQLANIAAGVIVEKPGTASLTYKEFQKIYK